MEREIKWIYIGLPDEFKGRVLRIEDEFRTNPLSLQPGGSDVVIEYHDGNVFGYDRIKDTTRYISTIFSKKYNLEIENFEERSESSQMDIVKSKICRIYARNYKDENDFKNIPFKEIWNHSTSKELPWTVLLKTFDLNAIKSSKSKEDEMYHLYIRKFIKYSFGYVVQIEIFKIAHIIFDAIAGKKTINCKAEEMPNWDFIELTEKEFKKIGLLDTEDSTTENKIKNSVNENENIKFKVQVIKVINAKPNEKYVRISIVRLDDGSQNFFNAFVPDSINEKDYLKFDIADVVKLLSGLERKENEDGKFWEAKNLGKDFVTIERQIKL
jgi:hypothetical protein